MMTFFEELRDYDHGLHYLCLPEMYLRVSF